MAVHLSIQSLLTERGSILSTNLDESTHILFMVSLTMKVMKVIFFEKHKGNVEAKLSHWEGKIPKLIQFNTSKIFFVIIQLNKNEPRHEKTCLCHMLTTKAQISLRICLDSIIPLLAIAEISKT